MKNKKNLVSIVLPTFNERENITDLIVEIDKAIPENKEIIVVDDDSPDGTSKVVEELINKKKLSSWLRLETRNKNHGLTPSIWKGIRLAKGNIIVWMDADFSHPVKIIPKLLKKIEAGYDIAVASRFIKGGGYKKNLNDSNDSLLAVILSRLMNYSIQFLLDKRFKDYSSGFIAIKKEVFKDIHLRGDYGEYFMDLMVRAILLDYKFIEIPHINLPRKKGESKTGSNLKQLIKRGLKYILTAINLTILRSKYKLNMISKDDIKG